MFTAALILIAKPQKQSDQHIYNASTVCGVQGSTEVSNLSLTSENLIIYLMINNAKWENLNSNQNDFHNNTAQETKWLMSKLTSEYYRVSTIKVQEMDQLISLDGQGRHYLWIWAGSGRMDEIVIVFYMGRCTSEISNRGRHTRNGQLLRNQFNWNKFIYMGDSRTQL